MPNATAVLLAVACFATAALAALGLLAALVSSRRTNRLAAIARGEVRGEVDAGGATAWVPGTPVAPVPDRRAAGRVPGMARTTDATLALDTEARDTEARDTEATEPTRRLDEADGPGGPGGPGGPRAGGARTHPHDEED